MPSVNPVTGKRIPGNEQRKRAALRTQPNRAIRPAATERPAGATTTAIVAPSESQAPLVLRLDALANLPRPPIAQGVAAVASWSGTAAAKAAAVLAAFDSAEIARAVVVSRSIKKLGQLQTKATRSENALRLRKLRLHISYDLTTASQPDDDIALHAWAFMRVAEAIWAAAAAPTFEPEDAQRLSLTVEAFHTLKEVNLDAAIEALRQSIEA